MGTVVKASVLKMGIEAGRLIFKGLAPVEISNFTILGCPSKIPIHVLG